MFLIRGLRLPQEHREALLSHYKFKSIFGQPAFRHSSASCFLSGPLQIAIPAHSIVIPQILETQVVSAKNRVLSFSFKSTGFFLPRSGMRELLKAQSTAF